MLGKVLYNGGKKWKISELAWNNAAKVLKDYKEGDTVEAKIISIDDEKKNVKLSVKQLLENPWDSVKEKYSIGDVLERPVSEVFEFGLMPYPTA